MRRSFDEQAGSFDQRAGLPADVCDAVATDIVRLAELGVGDVLLEVGAGTGQIGHSLCGLGLDYIGFDSSAAMLEVFARRCRQSGERATLLQADGSHRWPLEDGKAKAVFGSRVLHLLPVDHVVAEVCRVASSDGAALVVGRVLRQQASMRTRLRQEMHQRLARCGWSARDGRKVEQQILTACLELGASPVQRSVVATWRVHHSPAQVLAAWREKPGLAGLDVPDDIKEYVLSPLAVWAKDTFGSLEDNWPTEESYVLEGVRLPARS